MSKRTIFLDGSGWVSTVDVYSDVLPALDAPAWHGRNLDALWDSLHGDDINGVRAPFEMIIEGSGGCPEDVRTLVSKIAELFLDAEKEGVDIQIQIK